MGTSIQLDASDGHRFSAYRADPAGKPRGGVLVIQEIFGLNEHIRAVCDGFARDGYVAIAPALFDRVEPGVELGYDGESMRRGVEVVMQLKPRDVLADMQATVDELAKAGKVGVVGYCYGGTMAWAAAARLERVAAASCYYGGQISRQKDVALKAPVVLHFGDQDAMIPPSEIDAIRAAHPGVPIHVYPAGHGFNCDQRGAFHQESAALARQRTLELFAMHLG